MPQDRLARERALFEAQLADVTDYNGNLQVRGCDLCQCARAWQGAPMLQCAFSPSLSLSGMDQGYEVLMRRISDPRAQRDATAAAVSHLQPCMYQTAAHVVSKSAVRLICF